MAQTIHYLEHEEFEDAKNRFPEAVEFESGRYRKLKISKFKEFRARKIQ